MAGIDTSTITAKDGGDLVIKEEGGTTLITIPDGGEGPQMEGAVKIKESAAAPADTAAYGQLWVKNDSPNNLYFVNDAGNEVQITNGTSLAGVAGSLSGLGSTDNVVLRANGTGGETAQGSGVAIDDSNNISGVGTLACGAITSTADTATFTSANSQDPLVIIKNTTNDANGARLQFVKDKGAAGADGDDIGVIEFVGDDAAQTQTTFAKIVAEVSEADDSDEAGKLSLFVAESDGTTTTLTAGLVLEGEHATDGEVDVTIGAGAASTTTVAGSAVITTDLSVDGTANLDNTDIDGTFTMDGTAFDVNATTTCAIDNTNTSSGVTINTATSGSPISIGHSVSETTVNDNLTVTGTTTLNDNVKIIDDKTLTFGTDNNWTIEYDENGDDDLVMTGDKLSIESSTAGRPALTVKNTNNDANGSKLVFEKKGGGAADDDEIAKIVFQSENSAGTPEDIPYVSMAAMVSDITDGDESGGLKFEIYSGGTGGTAAANNLFSIGFEDVANTTQCEVVVNEAGIDNDFRVEGDTETHLLFVEAANDRVSIGASTDSPAATFEVTNASDGGVPCVQINNNDVDKIGMDINLANTTVIGIDIDADNTTHAVMDITANALTSGAALNISTSATNDTAGSLVKIAQSGNRAGSAASVGLDIDFNTVANTAARALRIDSEQTTGVVAEIDGSAVTTGKVMEIDASAVTTGNGLEIKTTALTTGHALLIDADFASTGNIGTASGDVQVPVMHIDAGKSGVTGDGNEAHISGLRIDVVDTAVNHGNANVSLTGLDINVDTGNAQGEKIKAYGIEVTVENTNVDGFAHLRCKSSADTDDKFELSVAEDGETKFSSTDDAGTGKANFIFKPDGEIIFETGVANTGGSNQWDAADGVTSYLAKVNGVIETTFIVDFGAAGVTTAGTAGRVIAEGTAAQGSFTKIQKALNGIIYKVEMACFEDFAGSNITKDVDLFGNTAHIDSGADVTASGTNIQLINSDGNFAIGQRRETASGTILTDGLDNYRLYLVDGSSTHSGGSYSGGKVMVKLFGIPE